MPSRCCVRLCDDLSRLVGKGVALAMEIEFFVRVFAFSVLFGLITLLLTRRDNLGRVPRSTRRAIVFSLVAGIGTFIVFYNFIPLLANILLATLQAIFVGALMGSSWPQRAADYFAGLQHRNH
jgi:hydrogenase/urease accessory protein HupE